MLLHRSLGLATFNALPDQRAFHALYECSNSVVLAGKLTRYRPYADHESLLRRAEDLLHALPEESIDAILEAYPQVGAPPSPSRWQRCPECDAHPDAVSALAAAADRYRDRFGVTCVMSFDGAHAPALLAAVEDRLSHDHPTERIVIRSELARINRRRLQRMLGPEGGYDNWG